MIEEFHYSRQLSCSPKICIRE